MSDLTIRDATADDLPAIIALLAQDQMGGENDSPGPPLDPGYREAFDAIDSDPRNRLLVAEAEGRVVGTFQLSFIPGLLFHGGWRALIEAVRIDESVRGRGHGQTMMRWAIDRARERGCRVVQLTSNRARTRAHGFYERLGFVSSHVGMKLHLEP
ncbi:GNAT family N-acetyltransferase [Stakelama pacifica]|uniref:Ribosomal protein S18 acetylase RimI-like enzyme n=1 Tax=Stakelama pacifica TaxID=517720 RepID=A0A4R6FG42_9SPHN|nr:GNAT family N-acetyltransferase [Stakelama pacifica]TDN80299.1 ribosomal protein S18 acetylase RimI-like enzyme [Stakelama pacifica]GGO97912.1 acetyltransferase [Stakelama pacifica]